MSEKNKLLVGDVIRLTQTKFDSFQKSIGTTLESLKGLAEEYKSQDDLFFLENLKKEFNSHLQYLGTLYSYTKVYKGPNHTYLEVSIKQLKAKTLEIMCPEGKNITAAEKMYYINPYFTDRIDNIENIKRFFTEIEIMYEHYCTTLQCIQQSISVARGEFNNSKGD